MTFIFLSKKSIIITLDNDNGLDYKRWSKWPPRFRRIFSNLNFAHSHALWTRSGSILSAKSLTMDLRFSIVEGFVLWTWFMECPQDKKSNGFKSGELGGHGRSVLLDITRSANFDRRNSKFNWVVWQVAPSCMK